MMAPMKTNLVTTETDRKPCPHREFCGGCLYNGEDYTSVLNKKEREALGYFNNVIDDNDISDIYAGIEGADENLRFRYRNKMEYTFGDLVKDGPLQLGMHKKGNYMSVITTDNCQLVPDDFNRILGYTLDFAASSRLNHYHKKSHKGVLRNLIIRRGVRTGELIVNIVTSSEADEITDMGRRFDSERWKDGLFNLGLNDKIVGVMHTINDNIADTVNCDELRILYGRDYYYEEICDLKFKVNIFSFFQTNVEAVERLYLDGISLIGGMTSGTDLLSTDGEERTLKSGGNGLSDKIIYDLFCGTGTISQIVSKQGAKKVIGIEIVPDSVRSAKENAELNGISNCEFITGDVFEVLNTATDYRTEIPNPDIIILDPPRMGLRTKAVNKIASYGVPEILYISCNPKTLAIDLEDFKLAGYEPKYLKFYDNFCWTKHLECTCLLAR